MTSFLVKPVIARKAAFTSTKPLFERRVMKILIGLLLKTVENTCLLSEMFGVRIQIMVDRRLKEDQLLLQNGPSRIAYDDLSKIDFIKSIGYPARVSPLKAE